MRERSPAHNQILDFWAPEPPENKFLLFWTTQFVVICHSSWASQVALVVKNMLVNAGDIRDAGSISFHPWVRKNPLEEGMATTPVFLPRESCEQRSLVGLQSEVCRVRHD